MCDSWQHCRAIHLSIEYWRHISSRLPRHAYLSQAAFSHHGPKKQQQRTDTPNQAVLELNFPPIPRLEADWGDLGEEEEEEDKDDDSYDDASVGGQKGEEKAKEKEKEADEKDNGSEHNRIRTNQSDSLEAQLTECLTLPPRTKIVWKPNNYCNTQLDMTDLWEPTSNRFVRRCAFMFCANCGPTNQPTNQPKPIIHNNNGSS